MLKIGTRNTVINKQEIKSFSLWNLLSNGIDRQKKTTSKMHACTRLLFFLNGPAFHKMTV